MKLTSPAFDHQGTIPKEYTCEGQDISPALVWSDVPLDTKSFALIMDDPDAPSGIWVHWVIFNIHPTSITLPENFPKDEELPDSVRQGKNSAGKIGYVGPCPPYGTHRYIFRLYALDNKLNMLSGITKEQLLSAMEGHILDQTQLIGLYQRTR